MNSSHVWQEREVEENKNNRHNAEDSHLKFTEESQIGKRVYRIQNGTALQPQWASSSQSISTSAVQMKDARNAIKKNEKTRNFLKVVF